MKQDSSPISPAADSRRASAAGEARASSLTPERSGEITTTGAYARREAKA